MSVEVVTLGCRLNAAESAAMAKIAEGRDMVIVNSCAVTSEAVKRTRQAIRRARKARPGAQLVVTGCAAQIEPGSFAAMPEVDRVVGNLDKLDPAALLSAQAVPSSAHPELVEGCVIQTAHYEPTLRQAQGERWGMTERVRVSDIMAVREHAPHLLPAFSEGTRAFVEVQNGCDHRCTFCIIPYGRGNSRSVPAGAVVDQIRALVDGGYQEVVLTGVDVTSYGPDLPGGPSLGMLVERILTHVPGLKRLRLSSIDSVEIDPRLEEIITGEARFMPHLHMSFQAGDDMVLKRMKRRHSRAQAVETVARLKAKRPEIAIGADLIAGFPTETDEMAANSLVLIEDCDIVMAHVFPYSPRPGTPAARMPQVPGDVVKARAKRLREAADARRAQWLAGLVGTTQRVLVERSGAKGHAENFAPVLLRHSRESGNPASCGRGEEQLDSRLRGSDVGKLVAMSIVGVEGDMLIGEAR